MQLICLVYNIPGLDAVTAVDGSNTGNVDSEAILNKPYKSTLFLSLKLTLSHKIRISS